VLPKPLHYPRSVSFICKLWCKTSFEVITVTYFAAADNDGMKGHAREIAIRIERA
jgi:hypothetical protein